MGKIFLIMVCFSLMACSHKNGEAVVDYSATSFGALTGKSKIVQKPTLIKRGIQPLNLEEARGYMSGIYSELGPDLEKTNITYQMAGSDIILTVQSHIILDNSMKVVEDIKPQLSGIIKTLSKYDRNYIEVTGHTSSIGGKNENLRKSVNMAQAVADYFMKNVDKKIKKSIMPERIFVNGVGESMWISDNNTREGQLLNQRIEIRISPLI